MSGLFFNACDGSHYVMESFFQFKNDLQTNNRNKNFKIKKMLSIFKLKLFIGFETIRSAGF
jgi:hypothetical protein